MATYTPLQSIKLTSAATSITFSTIDQTYTDLVVKTTGFNSTLLGVQLRFNGDTNGNYSETVFLGSGTSAIPSRGSAVTFLNHGYTDTTIGVNISTIFNYASTVMNKSMTTRWNSVASSDPYIALYAGLWKNTSAITSITLSVPSGTLSAGFTFDLYGIRSGSASALGGDLTITDGNYWYHVFTNTGTFTPNKALSVDYLVVAGGGGGAKGANAGAGGAGGLRSTVTATGGGGALESKISLTAQAYTVTVGAGGPGGVNNGNNGTVGSNSIFSSITSTGGGYGGGPDYGSGYNNGGPGGSGGGGGLYNTLGGAASPAGQGYAGGASVQDSGGVQAGGGGGAGAVGTTGRGTGPVLGVGGAGLQLTAFSTPTNTGASGYYAGGGGGGANAGTAAGGAGGGGTAGTAGTINTGGGGGGAGNSGGNTSGAGGSGIVIVRYAV